MRVMRSFRLLLVVGVAALMVLGVVPAASAAPLVVGTVDHITYSADPANVSAGATVVGYDTAGGKTVSIPLTVTLDNVSYRVTTIGDGAFADDLLTSVTIHNSVTTIGAYAFQANSLTSVTIPNSVTTIGGGTFSANQLTSVTIGTSVTTIGTFAFYYNSLTSVTIPTSVTTIGTSTFRNNSLNRPGLCGGSDSPKDDDHASIKKVSAGVAGSGCSARV